jgi:glutamine synthetase
VIDLDPTETQTDNNLEAREKLIASIVDQVEANEIELIRFLWVDHNGIARGKAVTGRFLQERLLSGIGLAKCRQAANVHDQVQPVPGFNAVGEVRMVPDPTSFILLPHASGSAAMLCDLVDISGRAWGACPRQFLKESIASAGAFGFELRAAFEPEFTLCQEKPSRGKLTVFDDSLCFDAVGFDLANEFAVTLVRNLGAQGIPVELYHPEFGAGQHEMTIRYAPALRAADAHVWQRLLTRGLALKLNLWATFAPCPHPGFRGNGNHVHLSLWHDGVNVFSNPSDRLGLSEVAYHFIGGLLAHAPALVALTCASVNSFRRLRPRLWSGAFACYGPDNREAAVRVPSRLRGQEDATTNIEFKPCDATANPYLALGALLVAGMDGIRRSIDPLEPLAADPNELSETERERRAIRQLPTTLETAIEALERDEVMMQALGPLRSILYPAIKRSDIRQFRDLEEESEFLLYAARY